MKNLPRLDDLACIGVLLDKCSTPPTCPKCWFSNDKDQPTLVSIRVFARVQKEGNK